MSTLEIDRVFQNRIQPHVEELKRIVQATMRDGDLFVTSACTALDRLVVTLKKEALFHNDQRSYRKRKTTAKVSQIVEELRRDGIALRRIQSERVLEIWNSLEEHRNELLQRREGRPKSMASCVKSLPKKGPHWNIITRELRNLGVIEAVGEFSQYKMDLDYCALHLAHEYEDWYQGCYSDVGLGTQKTTYMHFDQDYALIKMMIYLNEFDEKLAPLAPFSIIKGKHWMSGSYVRSAFYKELDVTNAEVIATEDKTGTSYYRPVFKYPKYRKEFLKLPAPLQGTSHFGDDIVDGSELSNHLLSIETKMTAELANCALFNGGNHIHRGGMVGKGERWALQVGFRMSDPSMRGRLQKLKLRMGLHAPDFAKKVYRTIRPRPA